MMLLLYQLQQMFKLIFTEYSPIVVTEDSTAYLKLRFPRELFKLIGLKHCSVEQDTLTNIEGRRVTRFQLTVKEMLFGVKPFKSLPKLWWDWNQEPLSLWVERMILDEEETDILPPFKLQHSLTTPSRLCCAAGLNDMEVQGNVWFWFCDNAWSEAPAGQCFMRGSFLM